MQFPVPRRSLFFATSSLVVDFALHGGQTILELIDPSDYINPIDLCNRLNAYIVPEAAVHAFLTFLFVINGYWIAIILNLPLMAFNAKKYVSDSIGVLPE